MASVGTCGAGLRRSLAAAALLTMVTVAMPANAQTARSGLRAGLGGDPNIFGPLSSYPAPTNLPGLIQFYLKGRLNTDMMAGGDSLDHGGGNKYGAIYFGEYARLYTGFAGTAANGLRFGAYIEIRQNGSSALGAPTSDNTLFFRRETGYVKGSWGKLQFGQIDGASGMFLTGVFTKFDTGGWHSPDLVYLFSGNAKLFWPFPSNVGYYGTSKVVYVSPQYGGFDFALSYEPNQTNSGEANCASALTGGATGGCPRLSTIAGPTSAEYRRNMIDAVGRYMGKVGHIGVTATAGIMHAGHVNNLSAPASDPTGVEAGLQLAYGGFAIGGNLLTGNFNGTFVPVPKGGHHESAWVAGTSYANGPFVVGAQVLSTDYQGVMDPGLGETREFGVAVGGTYAWAPGSALYLSMLYGQRHQHGYDFATGKPGLASNNTRAMGFMLGNQFNW